MPSGLKLTDISNRILILYYITLLFANNLLLNCDMSNFLYITTVLVLFWHYLPCYNLDQMKSNVWQNTLIWFAKIRDVSKCQKIQEFIRSTSLFMIASPFVMGYTRW